MTHQWEMFESKGAGGHGYRTYGHQWDKFPAVSITSTGLTFNERMLKAYSGGASQCLVMRDTSNGRRLLGIKFVERGQEMHGAFTMKRSSKTAKTRNITCREIVKEFQDLKGVAFRAMSDPQGKVIVVDLSPENRLK